MIMDNSNILKPQFQINDQLQSIDIQSTSVNSILLQCIQHWWKSAKFDPLSKLWKITKILIISLLFTSCMGKGEGVTVSSNIDTAKISAVIDTKEIVILDSILFTQIIDYLENNKLYINKGDIIEGDKFDDKNFIMNIKSNKKLIDGLSMFRQVRFDDYATKKPMSYIQQLIFKENSTAMEYLSAFSTEHSNVRKNNIGYIYFVTKKENTVYLFQSGDSAGDKILWNIKQNIDTVIIKPNEEDMKFNQKNRLNKF